MEGVDARWVTADREGFLWVAGEKGTYRFDGKVVLAAKELGLPVGVNDWVEATSDGAVWVLSGESLWRLEEGRFRMVSGGAKLRGIAAAGDRLYSYEKEMQVWVRLDGGWAAQNLGGAPARGLILGDGEGRVWYGGEGTAEWVRWREGSVERGREKLPAGLGAEEVLPTGTGCGWWWCAGGGWHWLQLGKGGWKEDGGGLELEPPKRRRHLFPGKGGVWGLPCTTTLSNFSDSARSVVLRPRHSPLGLAEDPGGTVWAGNLQFGVSGMRSGSEIQIPYGATKLVGEVHGIARVGGRLLLATESEVLEMTPHSMAGYRLCDGGTVESLGLRRWAGAPKEGDYLAVLAESDGSIWTVAWRANVVRTDRSGRSTEVVGLGEAEPRPAKTIWDLAWSEDDRLSAASKENLIEIARKGAPVYRPLFSEIRYFGRFVRDRRNRLYGISQEGLLRYESGGWRELGWPGCVLTGWVRTVAVISDDEYWLSYRTRDGFTHATRKGEGQPWSCEHFEVKGGFPGDTQLLRLDRQGRLWRGSESGLFFARDAERRPPSRPEDWNLVGGLMGMSEGEMGQVFEEEADGSILVVADRRLHRIPARMLEEDPWTIPKASFLRVGKDSRLFGHGNFVLNGRIPWGWNFSSCASSRRPDAS